MSNNWLVHWSPRAEKFARKLGKGSIRDRIRKKIDSLATDPKQGKYFPSDDVYSLRIGTSGGEYRAIYQLIPEDKTVLIILIASREQVYEILNRL